MNQHQIRIREGIDQKGEAALILESSNDCGKKWIYILSTAITLSEDTESDLVSLDFLEKITDHIKVGYVLISENNCNLKGGAFSIQRTNVPSRKWYEVIKIMDASKTTKICTECDKEIIAGMEYADIDGKYVCGGCLENMSPRHVLQLCGHETFTDDESSVNSAVEVQHIFYEA